MASEHKRQYDRQYHANRSQEAKDRKVAMQKQRIDRARKKLLEYLSEHPCVDCGETDPVVLEFDHVKDKENNVSNGIRSGWAWERLAAEIEKCEVRCANCHRRITYKRCNSYRIREDL